MYKFIYLLILLGSSTDAFSITTSTRNKNKFHRQTSTLYYQNEKNINENEYNNEKIPDFIESIVLKQVYPAMVQHKLEYGNPNIPLGSTEGKKVQIVRRLAFQKKLNRQEIELLESINFRFNSLEDIYEEADFDDCLQRLIDYEKEHQCNYQIPKKYKLDPELGAWVTMLRRIGKDNLPTDEAEKLTKIGFAWVSTRKCGSAFMSNYRPLKERLFKCCVEVDGITQVMDEGSLQEILNEDDVKKWIRAQADAAKMGNLSDARCDYMNQLPGFSWRDF